MDRVRNMVEQALEAALAQNEPGANRCRELSLAITKLEEALHWLNVVPEKPDGE